MTMTNAKLKEIEHNTNMAWNELMKEVQTHNIEPNTSEYKAIERKVMKYAVHYHHLTDALFETLS